MIRTSKILCAIGCVLLLVTAIFHATGYSVVRDAMAASSIPAFFRDALPGVWLHFSIHLVVLVFFGAVALFTTHGARSLLSLLALAVSVDAALVFYFAGFFAGVALLIAAALCFALAAIQHVAPRPASHGGT